MMAYSGFYLFIMKCDECGCEEVHRLHDRASCRMKIGESGWRTDPRWGNQDKVLCPSCHERIIKNQGYARNMPEFMKVVK